MSTNRNIIYIYSIAKWSKDSVEFASNSKEPFDLNSRLGS